MTKKKGVSKESGLKGMASGSAWIAQLEAIIRNISGGVLVSATDRQGEVRLVYANERYYEMFGYTGEQFQKEQKTPLALLFPEDAASVSAAVCRIGETGQTETFSFRAVKRDGSVIRVCCHCSAASLAGVDEKLLFSVLTDMTSAAAANNMLSEQHSEIVEILNATPSGIAVIEVDPRDVLGTLHMPYFNDYYYTFSGYSREEYGEQIQKDEFHFVFKEDIPALVEATRKMCENKAGEPVDCPIRCHTRDGGCRWLLLTGKLAEKRGDICVVNIALVDITARKQAIERQRISEEMLRIAAETDKRAVVLYDVRANICHVESRNLYSAKFGETIENLPESMIDKGIVSLESAEMFRALFRRISAGEAKITMSLQMRTGKEEYQWFECNAKTVFGTDGKPDHAVLVFHNITEQRVKEAVFRKWQQSIETRPKDTYTLFRCNLSKDAGLDEFDGNLLKIRFGPKNMSFNERTREYAEQFVYPEDREAYSALLDADTLLAMFYRGERTASMEYREIGANGEVLWRHLTVETVEYLNSKDVQAFLMYEDIDERKKAELKEKEMAETDPLTGLLNRAAFSQRVDSLILNGAGAQHALLMLDLDGFKQVNDRFGHAAGDQALLDVTAVLRSQIHEGDLVCRLGGDEFLIWLREIPYDAVIEKTAQQICKHVHKVFTFDVQISASIGVAIFPRNGHDFDTLYHNADKALYQVKQSGKDNYAFAAVKENQNAKNAAATEEKRLPAKSAEKEKTASAQEAKVRRRMLIVDDSGSSRAILENLFCKEYRVETARNGLEAMIRLRHFSSSISVVLLDLVMPGMDGFEVLRKMQNNADLRAIPVIVVSAGDDRQTALKAIEGGAADFVTKPVDPELIRIRVRSAVSKSENERLRAQNSYLLLQRDEKMKFRTVLESTGTVVVEYDWRNHVFDYDDMISQYLAGTYDHRSLWQVFLTDMVASSADVQMMQNTMLWLSKEAKQQKSTHLVLLRTPQNKKHWFRMNIYKREDSFGLAEKMIVTFNDVHEEVLANEKLTFQATHDELTGLYNRSSFITEAEKMIAAADAGYYVMSCIDIENFKVLNDQYGEEKGDEALKSIAGHISDAMRQIGGICCRYTADNFGMMYPVSYLESDVIRRLQKQASSAECFGRKIKIRTGRYIIDDPTLAVVTIYDCATMAEETIRGRYDKSIAVYDAAMRDRLAREQKIVNEMEDALKNGEFEPWFQPQYNHATGAMIGAEALARWNRGGEFISPAEFIPVFERNGFIYEMDQAIWEQVCRYLRRWIDEGRDPLPVSVNLSRRDLFHAHLVDVLTALVKKYEIPYHLLRLEVTESAFAEATGQITAKVDQLIELGFTVEIDDFGSGYSSLNTLKDVPASILKLDVRFFENTKNSQRGGNIVESVVRMARWLGMEVIAEGVEEKEQADYLKTIGCYYIQGYYYAKPMPAAKYEKCMADGKKETQLSGLQTLVTLDNNEFWNPKSMETLVFNSYVGGACIFEYRNGKTELLRRNDQYVQQFGGIIPEGTQLLDADVVGYLEPDGRRKLTEIIRAAIDTQKAASCEVRVSDGDRTEYVRVTVRILAQTGDRYLCYGVVQNITQQRKSEIKERNVTAQMQAILANMQGGVTATVMHGDQAQIIFANKRFYELYGYTKEQFEAEVRDVMDIVHPDDRASSLETARRVLQENSTATYGMRCIRRDGSVMWQHVSNSVLLLDGYREPILLAVYNDITALHAAQQEAAEASEKLRTVLNHAGNGITAIALRGEKPEFLFANDTYFDIIGYSRESYAAATAGDMLAPVDENDRENLRRVIETVNEEQKSATLEYRVKREDGGLTWVRSTITITHLTGIDVPVQIAVFADVTEEKETTEQLHFLNDTAHEILAQPDNEKAVCDTLQKIMRFFACERVCIMEDTPGTGKTDCTYEICADGIKSVRAERQGMKNSISGKREKGFIIIRNVDEPDTCSPEFREVLNRQGIRSAIIVRMRREGAVFGTIGIDNPARIPKNTERLRALGDYIAILLTRRDLERKIESDRRTMTALMDDTPGGFVRMKQKAPGVFVPVYANDGFAEMMGMTHEQLMRVFGEDVLAGVRPEDRDIVRAASEQMIAQGEAQSARFRVRNGRGQDIWLTMYGRKTKNEAGEIYLNVYYTDTTKQVSEEQKQKALLDNLPVGAALYEYDGQNLSVIHRNRRYWEMVKRKPEAVEKEGVLKTIHPDDRDTVRRELESAVRQKRDFSADFRVQNQDGGYSPFHVAAIREECADGNYRFYASYIPVSDEIMSIQTMLPIALSTMMSASDDYSYIKDKDLRYLCCSRSDAWIMGFESERDIIGKSDRELFAPEVAEQFAAQDARIMETGQPQMNMTEKIALKKDTVITVSTSKYPIKDTTGRVIGIYGTGHDITEQKEKELQLELLTESIPGGLATYLCRPEGIRTLYFNNGYCNLFGTTKEEYEKETEKDLLVFLFKEDRGILIRQYHRLMEDGTPIDCLYRIRTRTGECRWVHHRAVVSDRRGETVLVNAALFDITEQQREKEQLRLQEEEYRIATLHSGSTLCRFTVADRTLRVDQNAMKRLSLPDCLTDVPYSSIRNGRISEDTTAVYQAFYENIMAGKKENSAVFHMLLPTGWRWLSAHATTIFDRNGKPVSAIISYNDITDQQEKEAAYRKWLQTLRGKNPDFYTLYRCNLSRNGSGDTREGNLLKYQPSGDPALSFNDRVAAFCDQFVIPEDREKYVRFLDSERMLLAFSRGKRSAELVFRGKLGNGEPRWIRLSVELLEYPHSTDVEAYLMYEDINDAIENELQTKKMAETDPLTGLLNRKAFSDQFGELLRRKKQGVFYALFLMDMDGFKLINDNLGHTVGDRVLIDVGHAIRSAVRNSDLVCRLGGDEFLVCLCDLPDRDAVLRQAERVCAAVRQNLDLGLRVSVSLGIAVCPDDGNTFEVLYRKADKALYDVKEHGKDSCGFYRTELENSPQEGEREPLAGVAKTADGELPRMLIVDDNPINGSVMANIFCKDFLVETVHSGSEALIYLRRNANRISVVLLDLIMPEMDGYAVLEKMQNSAEMQNIPVIVVSGEDEQKACLRVIRAGASDFVTKPIDAGLLRLRVASAVSRAENGRLKRQNLDLARQEEELRSLRALMERESAFVITYQTETKTFSYDSRMIPAFPGIADGQSFWDILKAGELADEKTAEKIRKMVSAVASARTDRQQRAEISLKLSGEECRFVVRVMRRSPGNEKDPVVLIVLHRLTA